MKKSSIGSWAYTIGPYADNPVPFDTVCTKLKEFGFGGVELGGFAPHPNPDDLPEKSQRNEVVARMEEWGLQFSGLAANLWGERLISADTNESYLATFRKNAQFAEDLGIQGIRVDCTEDPRIIGTIEGEGPLVDQKKYSGQAPVIPRYSAFKRVAETWKLCCKIAANHGLYVTWEIEPGFAFDAPSDAVAIHDAVSEDNFGIQYDTCHGQMIAVVGARQVGKKETVDGGQLGFIHMLSGRINHIHLIDSDNTLHDNHTSTHPPFGEGVIDFDQVVPALAKEKLSHDWWTVDLCFWPNAWDATARCKTFLDELIRKYGS